MIKSPSEDKRDEMRCPGSISEAEKRGEFLLPLPFVLFKPSMNWMMPTHMGRATYFTEFTNSNGNLIWKYTPGNNV